MLLADLGPLTDGNVATGGTLAFILVLVAAFSKYQRLFVTDAAKRLEAMQEAASKAEQAKDATHEKLEETRRVADQAVADAEARAGEQEVLAAKVQRQYLLAKRALRDCHADRKQLAEDLVSVQARVALLSTERSDVADMRVELAAMRATVAALTAPARRARDAPDADHLTDRALPPDTNTPLEG